MFLLAKLLRDTLLERMGREARVALAAFGFAVFSVPVVISDLTYVGWMPTLFVYQYVVSSCVVWYVRPSGGLLRALLPVARIVGLVGPLFSGLVGWDLSNECLNNPQSMPAMVIGFSAVLLAARSRSTSVSLVSKAASCAFAAFLLQYYPSSMMTLQKVVSRIAAVAGEDRLVRIGGGALLVVGPLIVVAVDSVRQFVFSLTCDRR